MVADASGAMQIKSKWSQLSAFLTYSGRVGSFITLRSGEPMAVLHRSGSSLSISLNLIKESISEGESVSNGKNTHHVLSLHHSSISETRSHTASSDMPYCSYLALWSTATPVRFAISRAALFSPRRTNRRSHTHVF